MSRLPEFRWQAFGRSMGEEYIALFRTREEAFTCARANLDTDPEAYVCDLVTDEVWMIRRADEEA